jgi:LmbE family N-acetylglucosaminyl deacetylase
MKMFALRVILSGLVVLLLNVWSYGQDRNPESIDDWRGKTILYFSPHPDDEIRSSGTLAKLVNNGNTVYIILFTNGNKGSRDLNMTSERLAQIRRDEDIAANGKIGIPEENIFFLGYDDGMLEYVPEKELCEKVCWYVRKYRPDAVFCYDPGSSWMQWHKTDHRMSAFITVDGARAAAYHLYFPQQRINEGLQPFTVRDFFFFGSREPNYKVDITNVAELKYQASIQHTSQFGKGNIKYTGPEMDEEDKASIKERRLRTDSDGKIYEEFRRLEESLSF